MIRINPLWWLHLRITGSAKSNIYLVLGYVGLVLTASMLSYNFLLEDRESPSSLGTFYSVWAGIISGGQAIFLLLLIPSAIKRAVQRDYQAGIVETLRLTPLSNWRVIMGYLIGPALPTLLLFATGVVMGGYFSAQASRYTGALMALGPGQTILTWLVLMGLLAVGATMISSISLLSAIAVREHKFNILGLMIVGSLFGGAIVIFLVPGLALLTGIMGGSSLFGAITRGVALGDTNSLYTGAVLQSLFALTFLAAAGRRYRRSEQPVFTLDLSLILLALLSVTLLLGMVHALPSENWTDLEYQLVASLIVFMAVSMFVMNAAAADRLRLDRAAAFEHDKHTTAAWLRSSTPLLVTVVGCLLMVGMVLVLNPAKFSENLAMTIREPYLWAAVGLALLFSSWIDYSLLYIANALRWKTWAILLVSWGILRFLPVMMDGWIAEITREMADRPDAEWLLQDYLMSSSPVGIFLLVFRPCYEIGAGLAVQLTLALLFAGGAQMLQPKTKQ